MTHFCVKCLDLYSQHNEFGRRDVSRRPVISILKKNQDAFFPNGAGLLQLLFFPG